MAREVPAAQHLRMTATPATANVTPVHERPAAKYVLTAEGVEGICAELVRLREQKGREISSQLREARGFGEGAGNDEYLATREEELVLDARIASLEEILGRASVIEGDGPEAGVVAIGSTVTVAEVGAESKERYRIVGMHEQHGPGDVSAGSPLGRELLGRRRTDVATVRLPSGRERQLRILATKHPAAAS